VPDESDLELLRIEMGVLWDFDARGRIRANVDLVIGIAAGGRVTAIGQHVSDDRAAELAARENLDGMHGGPSYYVEKPIVYEHDIPVVRSDSPHATDVLTMRPDNWQPDEWVELVNGGAGAPWAMVLHKNRVVSICHSPRNKPTGAEAGTWTDPEFRGRGYAAATTAAWSEMLSTHLFYSTSAENYSSQHVAERLGLRPIGWIWKLEKDAIPGERQRYV